MSADATHPKIVDRCPTCRNQSLFIGEGGYLTCSVIGCKNPGVGDAIEKLHDKLRESRALVARQEDEARRFYLPGGGYEVMSDGEACIERRMLEARRVADLQCDLAMMLGALDRIAPTPTDVPRGIGRLCDAAIERVRATSRAADTAFVLIQALERLSTLGNGEVQGNSDGNRLAQQALMAYTERLGG